MSEKPVALVTGGSRGIGAAICRALARDGHQVIIHCNNSIDKAHVLAKEISGTVIQANLEDDEQIEHMFAEISKTFGTIDLLVNNAGIAECEVMKDITKNSFLRTMQVNLWAAILCTQNAMKIMRNGSIIFTSSVCAQRPTPDAPAYAASKAGIESIMRSIAAQVAPSIRVNCVAPAATDTDMMRTNYTEKDRQYIQDNYPMKGPSLPEDIAEMVAFLASEKAKNITGQIFTVDSGSGVRP